MNLFTQCESWTAYCYIFKRVKREREKERERERERERECCK